MAQINILELLPLFLLLIAWAIPIVAAVWIILTLKRIRSDHEIILGKIEEMRRLLLNKN
ncbi:MAG TPA: hypothetical protein VMG30_17610 [Acidobacteriota bacterium]|nr:hypothetical protein [Acidobacteriota bacterium]